MGEGLEPREQRVVLFLTLPSVLDLLSGWTTNPRRHVACQSRSRGGRRSSGQGGGLCGSSGRCLEPLQVCGSPLPQTQAPTIPHRQRRHPLLHCPLSWGTTFGDGMGAGKLFPGMWPES